ncbi:MAG: phosphodiesterase [Clostridia bacterium]|nr:phosphodiesterase [Clostridia bacterium]
MRLLVASDIHGDISALRRVLSAFESEGAERLMLLGDLLYHGPRNNLPRDYAPKEVIELLNSKRDIILAVRGNCDTEVDQMVLDFPIMADYAYISLGDTRIFATHGHRYNLSSLPPLRPGEVLLHGHTHVPAATPFGEENLYLNPGSAAIPKENFPPSYIILADGTYAVKDFAGNIIFSGKI